MTTTAAIVALASLVGCSETRVVPSTQIMVVVDADETVRARATELTVLVQGGTGDDQTMHEPRFSPPRWPVHVAIVPLEGDVTRTLRVEARAIDAKGPFVTDLAVTSFVDDRLLELRMVLEASCIESMCSVDDTCEDGGCRSAFVDAMTLPDFVPGGSPPRDAGVAGPPALRDLALSRGSLTPAFDPEVTSYTATVPLLHHSLVVTATSDRGEVTVQGMPVDASGRSPPIALRGVDPLTHSVEIRVSSGAMERTYAVTVTRSRAVSELASIAPDEPHAADAFGWSIAHSPGTIVAGAPRVDTTLANAGAVYVFTDGPGAPTETQLIRSPTPQTGGHFGWSVALTPDGERLFVGDGRHDGGAIHKYARAAGGEFSYVDSTEPLPGLGSSLATDGATLVAGADASAQVHVFDLAAIGFTAQTLIDDSMSGMGADAGIAGDLLVASGPSWMKQRGAIYTSARTGTTWSPVARQGGAVSGNGFGWAVALRGPWDGQPALLAAGSWASLTSTGSVAVYERAGLEWVPVEPPPSPGTPGGIFGWRVALSGDVLVATAPAAAEGAGTAHVFVRTPDGSSWTALDTIRPSGARAGDQFGGSWSRGVLISGDRLFVASVAAGPRLSESFPIGTEDVGAGRVYVFE
jgi:hypothetical protein